VMMFYFSNREIGINWFVFQIKRFGSFSSCILVCVELLNFYGIKDFATLLEEVPSSMFKHNLLIVCTLIPVISMRMCGVRTWSFFFTTSFVSHVCPT
jgi:hypothetical protein